MYIFILRSSSVPINVSFANYGFPLNRAFGRNTDYARYEQVMDMALSKWGREMVKPSALTYHSMNNSFMTKPWLK